MILVKCQESKLNFYYPVCLIENITYNNLEPLHMPLMEKGFELLPSELEGKNYASIKIGRNK